MRNIRVISHERHTLDLHSSAKEESKTHIRAIAVDPQESNIYAATGSTSTKSATAAAASSSSSSLIDLDIWQLAPRQRHLASFSAPQARSDTSRASEAQQIVSLDYLSDGGSFVNNEPALCIVCAGGDIAVLAISDDNEEDEPLLPEIVGSVEQGILAASWSADEELLILVTAPTPASIAEDGRDKGSTLLIMTRDFEVLSEEVLQTDDFGEERPITVGWGSKATQFHGSEGKQAAEAAAAAAAAAASLGEETSAHHASRGAPVFDDDRLPRISWRGDSNIFAVSSVEAYGSSLHRLIRTFSKSGNLLATSDPSVPGVSHVLAFKPTGILMATTQRTKDQGHTLAFFERNGLPKGGFALPDVHVPVRELAWNSDGSLLAVWLASKVQIWSTGNYHWYLKQEIHLDAAVTCMRWHSEQPFDFYLATRRSVFSRSFLLESCVSMGKAPNDAACTAVVDGHKLLLTPFRIQNVPPPMCSIEIVLQEKSTPVDIAWADVSTAEESASILAVLFHPGRTVCYLCNWGRLGGKVPLGGRPVPTPKRLCHFDFGLAARQIAVTGVRKSSKSFELAVGVLASEGFESLKVAIGRAGAENQSLERVSIESLALGKADRRILTASTITEPGDLARRIFVQEAKRLRNVVEETLSLPAFCPQMTMLCGDMGHLQVVGLAEGGRLYHNSRLLAKDASSFAVTDHNIVWTNASHEARFLSIASLEVEPKDSTSEARSELVSLGRRVERGSRIVTTVPSTMSLVLQMPRGNLETIAPRPLVLEVIRRLLDEKRYGSAYRICRTHRLDMNLLVDYNRAAFLEDVPLFVKQVKDTEYLNLFLSSLREDDVTETLYKPLGVDSIEDSQQITNADKVNVICSSMRQVLRSLNTGDAKTYTNTILTTYIRQSPPDYESGLHMLQQLKEEDASLADEACKYIIFLTNANKLFDAALGTYDFSLPLLVAHHSPRKDPREYLPFLRELRDVQPLEMQRFRIDETLGRWSKALSWIVKAGDDHFDQARRFIAEHELYADALHEYAGTARLKVVQEMFGDWLVEEHRFKEAGILFAQCDQHRKAIEADIKAGSWREAFALATAVKMPKAEMTVLARRVAATLTSYGRNAEAATVTIDYLGDIEEGVSLLCKDLEYSDARRLCAMHNRLDLLETHLLPSLFDASEALVDEIGEIVEQGDKQYIRLAELRKKKKESPEDFHPEVDIDVDPIEGDDAFSQAFTAFTRFTRYTAFTRQGAGSAMSGFTMNSKRTRKSKRKDSRKQQTGKKGTIFEEDYLFESLQRLLSTRLEKAQKDTAKILFHVAQGFGGAMAGLDKCRRRAKDLQAALAKCESSMNEQAELLFQATKQEEQDMEVQRIKAIEEATRLGISWAQLQANGLFAPQREREKIKVPRVEWQLDLYQHLYK